ncbi:metallophosphoesterase [Prauserella oleivorans]|uniref:Metallophosphoesterase n=1 Tax=Prauserella oleivorans TaxID=1478153 RepID=A0ABW5WH28_9PSEU
MPRALVVSDEVDESLWTERVHGLSVDLVLAAGDLPFEYLEHLADALDVPLVFVPGNHDPDLTGFTRSRGLFLRAGFPAQWPGPTGGVNVDGRVAEVAGLRIAGLGGSVRYNGGPNQWTQREQARRARRLVRRARGKPVDILLTHAPPRGVGDLDDRAHQGFDCLHQVADRLRPRWLLHGHIHPYGEHVRDRHLDGTLVRNVVGSHLLELDTEEPAEAR